MFGKGLCLQRLFSTFAGGWPGFGLLLQRLVVGTVLCYRGIICLSNPGACTATLPQLVSSVAGAFLLVGLWTPLAGTLVAIAGGWIMWSGADKPVSSILLTALGATLAMIGPGALSIDARLFGRRHINVSEL